MDDTTAFRFIITFTMEFITGSLLNGFITGVNCVHWVKRRKISAVDHIITALAISRIALMLLVVISILFSLAYSVKMTKQIVKMINISWVVFNHFNLWLSTKLSIFYFFKIVNFSNSVFRYLKWRLTKVFSVTLTLSLVLLFSHTAVINNHIDVWIDGYGRNLSYHSNSMNTVHFVRHILLINSLFAFIPFMASLVAFLLLIFSLWKHHKQMRNIIRSSRDTSTIAHIRALQTGITFLFLYTIFLLCLVIHIWSTEFLERYAIVLFSMATGIAFALLHSCVLIVSNPKLRRASFSMLLWLMCRSSSVGSSGP